MLVDLPGRIVSVVTPPAERHLVGSLDQQALAMPNPAAILLKPPVQLLCRPPDYQQDQQTRWWAGQAGCSMPCSANNLKAKLFKTCLHLR